MKLSAPPSLSPAAEWLGKLLKGGPVDSLQIAKDAKQSGIAQPTLERAKTKLRVKSRKRGFAGGWWWGHPEQFLPEDDQQDHKNDQQQQNVDHLRKPTPLKPSCGAGSTEGDQAPEGDPPSTPLKPSCGAGSTEGDQAPEKNEGVDHLRSNLAVVRVPGDPNSQGDQGFDVVGEKAPPTGGADLLRRVIIAIGEGPEKRSFETSDPAGLPLAEWQSRVLKAHGSGATVRGVPCEPEGGT